MRRKYTEKIHAGRLLGMLKKKNPCVCVAQLLKDTMQQCILIGAGIVKYAKFV